MYVELSRVDQTGIGGEYGEGENRTSPQTPQENPVSYFKTILHSQIYKS